MKSRVLWPVLLSAVALAGVAVLATEQVESAMPPVLFAALGLVCVEKYFTPGWRRLPTRVVVLRSAVLLAALAAMASVFVLPFVVPGYELSTARGSLAFLLYVWCLFELSLPAGLLRRFLPKSEEEASTETHTDDAA